MTESLAWIGHADKKKKKNYKSKQEQEKKMFSILQESSSNVLPIDICNIMILNHIRTSHPKNRISIRTNLVIRI